MPSCCCCCFCFVFTGSAGNDGVVVVRLDPEFCSCVVICSFKVDRSKWVVAHFAALSAVPKTDGGENLLKLTVTATAAIASQP